DGAVAADDDDFRPRFAAHAADIGEHFKTVEIGQPDIEQHHVVGRVLEHDHGFARRGGAAYAVAFLAQNLFERVANLRFVVHHQDVIHWLGPFATLPFTPVLPRRLLHASRAAPFLPMAAALPSARPWGCSIRREWYRRAPAQSWPQSRGRGRCRDAWWSRTAERAARESGR